MHIQMCGLSPGMNILYTGKVCALQKDSHLVPSHAFQVLSQDSQIMPLLLALRLFSAANILDDRLSVEKKTYTCTANAAKIRYCQFTPPHIYTVTCSAIHQLVVTGHW